MSNPWPWTHPDGSPVDPTGQMEPLTKGQTLVANYEMSMIAEPAELAEAIDKSISACVTLAVAETRTAIGEAFKDLLAHLVAATSAYETFAGNSKRPGVRDAFYSTRLSDYQKAVERGRKAYQELFGEPTQE
jgi:hypothetical protein